MEDWTSVVEWIPMGMVAIVAYFLKTLHTDIKNNVSEIGELRGEINANKGRIKGAQENNSIEIRALTKSVDELKDLQKEVLLKLVDKQ